MLQQYNSLSNTNHTEHNGPPEKQEDRKICATRFQEYIQNTDQLHSATVGVDKMVQSAIEWIHEGKKRDYLNRLWRNHPPLPRRNWIPWVDMSQSMEPLSKSAAIGIALKLAEASTLGKRILTFGGGAPRWIDLTETPDFVDCVEAIEADTPALNADIYSALDMVFSAIQGSSRSLEDTIWVILGDMQIDREKDPHKKPLADVIHAKYFGNTDTKPKIVYWNIKTTHGSPCSLNQGTGMSSWNPHALCFHGVP